MSSAANQDNPIPTRNLPSQDGFIPWWDVEILSQSLYDKCDGASKKATERLVKSQNILPNCLNDDDLVDENQRPAKKLVLNHVLETARRKRHLVYFLQVKPLAQDKYVVMVHDARLSRKWIWCDQAALSSSDFLIDALTSLLHHTGKDIVIIPSDEAVTYCRAVCDTNRHITIGAITASIVIEIFHEANTAAIATRPMEKPARATSITHLDYLEGESLHIIREVMAEAKNPVMLYSIGKDSAVLLHLIKKAFYPATPPFPLLHVDTGWKFQSMYQYRDTISQECGMDLIVYQNPEGLEKNIGPFTHGSSVHTDVMKTQGLKQAIDKYQFDFCFGGARRDEEKSRAKERIFSFRTKNHVWDPKNQRPELWNIYNCRKDVGESIRVFPLSNWTELDIWQYIYQENIKIVPLYFAKQRPVIEKDGMMILVDDDRIPLNERETIEMKTVRFRTLGCYPLTGAIESQANDLPSVILELLHTRMSERQGRAIDNDNPASIEKKKREGYF